MYWGSFFNVIMTGFVFISVCLCAMDTWNLESRHVEYPVMCVIVHNSQDSSYPKHHCALIEHAQVFLSLIFKYESFP